MQVPLIYTNKWVWNLTVRKEPWDLTEIIRNKHRINQNIPRLGPQKMCIVPVWSPLLRQVVYFEWPVTDARANEIPNSL